MANTLPPDDATIAGMVAAAAPLLGLTIAPEWQAAVAQNLKTVAAAAALVLDFPLDEALEPAPVFRP